MPSSLAELKKESRELVRALAAQALVWDAEAGAGEYRDRLATMVRAVPDDVVQGFGLRSSLGAYLIAEQSFAWAPPTSPDLRSAPLDRASLVAELEARGVDRARAEAVLGPELGPADFLPRREGLSPGELAGLAERSLSRAEQGAAVRQLAYSPRCLARLAVTCRALDSVRRALPCLPKEELELDDQDLLGLVGLALGRPERALELTEAGGGSPLQVTIDELAEAIVALEGGAPPALPDDPELGAIDREGSAPPAAPVAAVAAEEEDAFLEVVEERVPSSVPAPAPTEEVPVRRPRAPSWHLGPGRAEELAEAELWAWQQARVARRSLLAETGSILGIVAAPEPEWVPRLPIPPDPAGLARLTAIGTTDETVTEQVRVEELLVLGRNLGRALLDALAPPVRTVLRGIARAPEGHVPSLASIEGAGDLGWALRRARAIAQIASGDLEGALLSVAMLGGAASPEGRLAHLAAKRFQGRARPPADVVQLRRAAAVIAADLGRVLGRTVSGVWL